MAPVHTSEPASVVPGYTLYEEVHRGRRRVVYRATRDRDGAPVILRVLTGRAEGAETLGREFELIRSLDMDGVPRELELIRTGDRIVLVLEDGGRSPLKALIPAGGMDLSTFLRIGIQLSQILHGLHQRKIIHKDINPGNFLIDPTSGEPTLIDFSIASRMPRKNRPGDQPPSPHTAAGITTS